MTTINEADRWVIGSDKIFQFTIKDYTTGEDIDLSLLSGYGVVIYKPDGTELKFGYNILGFSPDEVYAVDATTFEVSLDKSLNTIPGIYYFRVFALWGDVSFEDTNHEEFGKEREILYISVNN